MATAVQILITAAKLFELFGHRYLTSVANKAKPPIANVPSRNGKIQTMRIDGWRIALGKYSSRTKSANMMARKIDDQRTHRLATRLNAAAK